MIKRDWMKRVRYLDGRIMINRRRSISKWKRQGKKGIQQQEDENSQTSI